jgi:hypothetical protein
MALWIHTIKKEKNYINKNHATMIYFFAAAVQTPPRQY